MPLQMTDSGPMPGTVWGLRSAALLRPAGPAGPADEPTDARTDGIWGNVCPRRHFDDLMRLERRAFSRVSGSGSEFSFLFFF